MVVLKSLFLNKILLVAIFIFSCGNPIFAQKYESYFYEQELELSVPVNTTWGVDLGAGYRGLLQERFDGKKISGYAHEHLEINQFTNFKARETVVLSLGLRYRFKELFGKTKVDEFRIIEQMEVSSKALPLPLSHRVRLEQRFREHVTHRLRYELGASRQLNKTFSLEAATEALYAISKNLKPEAEQRFSIGLENSSFKDLELGLAFEYRMENYADNLEHEFFIVTGLNLTL